MKAISRCFASAWPVSAARHSPSIEKTCDEAETGQEPPIVSGAWPICVGTIAFRRAPHESDSMPSRTALALLLSLGCVSAVALTVAPAVAQQMPTEGAPPVTPPSTPAPAAPPAATPPAAAPPAPATPPPAATAPAEHGTPAFVLSPEESEGTIGKSVRSASGEDMGRIVDIIVTASNQPRAAIIDFGGFLGVGSRKIAVDWRLLQYSRTGKTWGFTFALNRNQVRVSPEYKPGEPVVVLGVPQGQGAPPAPPPPVAQATPPPAAPPPATQPAQEPTPPAPAVPTSNVQPPAASPAAPVPPPAAGAAQDGSAPRPPQ